MTDYRIWPSASGPSNADNGDPVTLGTRFRLSATGWVTHLHYWRGTTDDNGTHQGVIYLVSGGTQVSGTLVTFVDSGTGWQTAALAAPVELAADTMYCVAVFHPNGRPAFTGAYWVLGGPGATGITNGILTAPNSADASGQGTFNGSGSLAHPTGSFNQTNYWNDVTISDVDPAGETASGTGATTATAALTSSGSKNSSGTAATSGSAALASAGAKGGQGTGTTGGTAATASVGNKGGRGTGATTATAALASVGAKTSIGTAALAGTAALTASGGTQRQGAGSLTATAALTATGSSQRAGTGALTAVATLASVGHNPDNVQPDWDFALGPPYTDSFRFGPPHL